MTDDPATSSIPVELPADGNSLRDVLRRPLPAAPPNQSEARLRSERRPSSRAGSVAVAACVCTATGLLLSVALMAALLTDNAAQDFLFVLGAIIGTAGIFLAVVAVCLSGRMSTARRRFAMASIAMASIQVLFVPLIALFGLASFYNNF